MAKWTTLHQGQSSIQRSRAQSGTLSSPLYKHPFVFAGIRAAAMINQCCISYRYDFFIVSQAVRCGSVSPTHYNVVYDTSGLKPDHMQRLTYKLCHMYYNWQVRNNLVFSVYKKKQRVVFGCCMSVVFGAAFQFVSCSLFMGSWLF